MSNTFCNGSSDGSFIRGCVLPECCLRQFVPDDWRTHSKVIEPRFSGDRVAEFDSVTDGVNRSVRRLQVVADGDSSGFADLQFCGTCQCRFRTYADGKDNDVGRDGLSVLEDDFQSFPSLSKEATACSRYRFTFVHQMLVHKGCHGEVDGSHHLIAHFHNRNF